MDQRDPAGEDHVGGASCGELGRGGNHAVREFSTFGYRVWVACMLVVEILSMQDILNGVHCSEFFEWRLRFSGLAKCSGIADI